MRSYWKVCDGLGFSKSAEEFGAVPIDPYSHSPSHAGAQQPGMTGAVKEEILARRRELGVRVVDGEVRFDSLLLRDEELLASPTSWPVRSIDGRDLSIELPAGSLGMTLCQVPVILSTTHGDAGIHVDLADGRTIHLPGGHLGRELSASIFERRCEVRQVRVAVTR